MHRWILSLMILNMLLLSTSYTIVMPFIPIYLNKQLGASPEFLGPWSGACYAITFIIAAIASPLWGRFADKSGKKLMLIRVSFLLSLAYLLCFIASNPIELFFARAFQGLASGMWPAVLAIISGFTPKNKAGIVMGMAQSANLLGTILGPAIGGFLVSYISVKFCFMLTCSISFFITILNIFFAKEPPKSAEDPKLKKDNLNFKDLFKLPNFKILLLANASCATVIMLLVPVVALHVDSLLLHSENSMEYAGLVFSASGLAGIIASPLWGFLCNKFEGFKVLFIACLGSGICYALQITQNSLLFFTILQFIAGLFICGIAPTVHTLIAQKISSQHAAKAYALTYACQQGGNCIGPIAAAITLYFANSYIVFGVAGIILLSISFTVFLKNCSNL